MRFSNNVAGCISRSQNSGKRNIWGIKNPLFDGSKYKTSGHLPQRFNYRFNRALNNVYLLGYVCEGFSLSCFLTCWNSWWQFKKICGEVKRKHSNKNYLLFYLPRFIRYNLLVNLDLMYSTPLRRKNLLPWEATNRQSARLEISAHFLCFKLHEVLMKHFTFVILFCLFNYFITSVGCNVLKIKSLRASKIFRTMPN